MRTRRSGDNRHVILFMTTNHTLNPLKRSEECAEIYREIKMSPNRDHFRFESRWAVSIDELMRHLMELDPTVVHFSAHGHAGDALMLYDEQGHPQPIPSRALAHRRPPASRRVDEVRGRIGGCVRGCVPVDAPGRAGLPGRCGHGRCEAYDAEVQHPGGPRCARDIPSDPGDRI